MKHVRAISRTPKTASIDLNNIFSSKVEAKENVINQKAGAFR